MKVLFISPHFPPEMNMFTQGLAEVGAEIYGVADVPTHQMPEATRRCLTDFLQLDLRNENEAFEGIVRWLTHRKIDRIECLWEPFVILAARLREKLDLPGLSVDTAVHFRDKDLMKRRLREAGVRVAKSRRVRNAEELRSSAEEIGFPVIIKPIAGAGSADTYQLDSMADLEKVIPLLGHVEEGNLEEFIEGDEFTFDAVTINGEAKFYSITQYHPKPLDSRSHEWISPAQITFKNPDAKEVADGRDIGLATLKAMRMGTGFTHAEWFRKKDGEVVLGEIACRSGGGHLVDMMNYANDFSIPREWANCVCFDKYEGKPSRQYFVSAVFKRAHGQGYIRRIEGLEAVRQRLGAAIVREELLPIGAPRRDWLQTLVSDGFIMFRHEEYDAITDMMWDAVRNLKLYAST